MPFRHCSSAALAIMTLGVAPTHENGGCLMNSKTYRPIFIAVGIYLAKMTKKEVNTYEMN
jgi:hypothetical protein